MSEEARNFTLWTTDIHQKTFDVFYYCRIEFDAYKSDLEFYASAPKTEVNQNKQRETQEIFDKQRQEFEKLRSDVQIKLKFLDENRVRDILPVCSPMKCWVM